MVNFGGYVMENNVEKVDLDHIDWKSSRDFFESLGDALDKLDDKDESYNFTWVGKRKSIIEAGAPINKTLRPDVEASKDFDNTKNMLIVGDNLDALKLLQESYLGKIKMIYIDPPYNTGHDFIYHDNFTIKRDNFSNVTKDPNGNIVISEDRYIENAKSSGRFHSDWLSMMYPRLKLARNLLSDNGVIFISIDENEQANLHKICNDIFGEENHIGTISWRRSNSQANIGMFSTVKDYILIYAKSITTVTLGRLPLSETAKKEYQYRDEVGTYARTPLIHLARGKHYFSIKLPNKSIINGPWMVTEQEFNELQEKNLIHWPENGGNPMKKVYLKDQLEKGQIANDFWNSDYGNNKLATEEIKRMFDGICYFDNPKPTLLLRNLLNLGSDKSSIILDFFAGSGTTGHATLQLNAKDGGDRQYILVQLDEKINDKSEAKKAGYDTIDRITAERLRRAGDRIAEETELSAPFERAEKTGLAATYIDEEAKAYGKMQASKLDIGFRVFRIDSSNESEDIRRPLGQSNQLVLADTIDNIKKDRTPLDLLFGIVYASALPFDLELEIRKIGANTVYLYGYLDEETGLVACFDNEVSEATVKEIAELKPLTAAFRDSSFKDSAEKINLSEHFRVISPNTKVKVI